MNLKIPSAPSDKNGWQAGRKNRRQAVFAFHSI